MVASYLVTDEVWWSHLDMYVCASYLVTAEVWRRHLGGGGGESVACWASCPPASQQPSARG